MPTLTFAVPSELTLQVTPAEFTAIAAVNRDLRLERTASGELIVNPPTGGTSGKRNRRITGLLDLWCEANEGLGEGFDSSTGFRLPNGATRAPDASWVRRDRWDALTKEEKEGFPPLCPDLVVELRSKTDSLSTLQDKMQEYIDSGARLGWLIDPQNRRVEIYRSGKEVELLDDPSQVSGEEVLPSFILDLRRVW